MSSRFDEEKFVAEVKSCRVVHAEGQLNVPAVEAGTVEPKGLGQILRELAYGNQGKVLRGEERR